MEKAELKEKTMTHPELVAALVKPATQLIADLTSQTAHLMHMAIGISGEVAELCSCLKRDIIKLDPSEDGIIDSQNLIEELGDLEFYIEGYYQGIFGNHEKRRRSARPPGNELVGLVIEAGELLDITKKAALYCKPLEAEKALKCLENIHGFMAGIYARHSIAHEFALGCNIEKLQKRYNKGKFTNQSAQERADKKEETMPPEDTDKSPDKEPQHEVRELTSHKVNGCNEQLFVAATDDLGPGGANHKYVIRHIPEPGNESSFSTNINFQNGPIKESGVNGVTHEALLAIIEDRLVHFQKGPFANHYNADALRFVREAMRVLRERTEERLRRGVEGTMNR